MNTQRTTRTIRALLGALLLVVMTAGPALARSGQPALNLGPSSGPNTGTNPAVAISPGSAPAGTSVTVTGTNFKAGDNIVIGYTSGDCTSNVTAIAGASGAADANGNITVTFTWPATNTGSYYICATDPSGHSTRSDHPFIVVAPPTLTVTQPVYSGQPVTVTGAHFAPSGTSGGSVDVSYGGSDGCATAAGTTTVGTDGSFSVTFNAPHADSNTPITITAVEPQGTCGKTGATGPAYQAQANASVSPSPSITVSSPLNAGQNATISGQHFLPAGTGVTISYGDSGSDGCATSLGSATTGADGSFSFSFKVPNVSSDKKVVIAATSPLNSCSASPKLKATADATFKAVKPKPTPPLLEYCLIGLLLLLLLLLLLFLIFRRRKEDEPVTIEERDRVVTPPSGTGQPGAALIDRQIVARDRRGKEYVIAEEVTTVEEEEERFR